MPVALAAAATGLQLSSTFVAAGVADEVAVNHAEERQ